MLSLYLFIYYILLLLLLCTYQQAALNSSTTSELVSKSVEAESEVFDSHANPNKEILVDNFRFTKAEDIMFALEMDGEYVFNLLCKKINEKPSTKSNQDTSMLEVIATVILRCFDTNAIEELYLVNLLHFNEPDVGLWKGMKANWALALQQSLPKNLDEYKELQQNELFFDNNGRPAGIDSFNFIRDLQWNNMEKEIEAIPVSIFRFWDQKDMKEKLFRCMEMNLFFTDSIHRFQNLIHIMTAMIKIRCKMASIQNEEDASKELDFKKQLENGKIRNPTVKEEFVKVIKEFKIPVEKVFIDSISEEYFSKTSAVAKVQSYLNIMYKYAGKEIDIMIDHFTNTAVYAVVIEDIIDRTVDKFHWNQNVILFLNRGATAIMHTEIWKRFLMARDEIFKTEDKIFMKAIKTVRELIHEDNSSLTFYSELEKSITKEALEQKQTVINQENETMQKKLKKRKFKVPYARKNEDTKIPFEKVTLSSAEMANTMEQKDTLLEKSDVVSNEEKLSADTSINTIPIHNRPSPIKEYRYNEFERSGRLSRNRVRDSKGTFITFYSNFSRKLMIPTPNNLYLWSFFSHGTNKKW